MRSVGEQRWCDLIRARAVYQFAIHRSALQHGDSRFPHAQGSCFPLMSELADWLWDCSVAGQRSELSWLVHNLADSKRRGSFMPGKRNEGEDSTQGAIEGKYANYFQIGHNAFEFLLDFGQLYSDGRRERFHTRIVTSPSYAKELLKVLGESVEQYETQFGAIKEDED